MLSNEVKKDIERIKKIYLTSGSKQELYYLNVYKKYNKWYEIKFTKNLEIETYEERLVAYMENGKVMSEPSHCLNKYLYGFKNENNFKYRNNNSTFYLVHNYNSFERTNLYKFNEMVNKKKIRDSKKILLDKIKSKNKYFNKNDINMVYKFIKKFDNSFDWLKVEKYCKSYPDLLHFYLTENYDPLEQLNKQQLKFANDNYLNKKQIKVMKEYNTMKLNRINNIIKKIEDVELQEKFKNLDFSKYEYKGKFTVVAPKQLNDLTIEGKELKHCVGGYKDRVVEEKSVILFLRKNNKPEDPYYTIDIRSNVIWQVRGLNNIDGNKQIKKFIKEYSEKKGLTYEENY